MSSAFRTAVLLFFVATGCNHMSTVYAGDAGNAVFPTSITLPADGDPKNAASVLATFQALADGTESLRETLLINKPSNAILVHSGVTVFDVFYNSTTLLLVAVGGDILSSSNGFAWTDHTPPAGTYMGVSGSASLYSAVGLTDLWATSPDGATWTSRTATGDWHCVHYANGYFVAGGNSRALATATDPTTAITVSTLAAAGAAFSIRGIHYSGGLWVAVGGDNTDSFIFTSSTTPPTSATWTQRATFAGTTPLNDVWFANGLWVAVGDDGTIATSPDGLTWTQRAEVANGFGTAQDIDSVCHDGQMWVAVGGAGAGTRGVLLTSLDGITWTRRFWPFLAANATNVIRTIPGSYRFVIGQSNPGQLLLTPAGKIGP